MAAYLVTAADPEIWDLPTRCAPWTVRDITRHLAATFARFADMLEQTRAGDLTPPFAKTELDTQNLRAVEQFVGVPEQRAQDELDRFLRLIGAGGELMAHQRGPVPVALQLLFGLGDIAVHHDDIAAASGAAYRPPASVIELLVPMWELVAGVSTAVDPWAEIVGRRK